MWKAKHCNRLWSKYGIHNDLGELRKSASPIKKIIDQPLAFRTLFEHACKTGQTRPSQCAHQKKSTTLILSYKQKNLHFADKFITQR